MQTFIYLVFLHKEHVIQKFLFQLNWFFHLICVEPASFQKHWFNELNESMGVWKLNEWIKFLEHPSNYSIIRNCILKHFKVSAKNCVSHPNTLFFGHWNRFVCFEFVKKWMKIVALLSFNWKRYRSGLVVRIFRRLLSW